MTRSRPRWAGPGLLALLACLALVVALTVATPDPATDYRRRFDDVGVGDWGQLQHAAVRVTSVRLTRSVAKAYGDPLVSDATFVVVDLQARVTQAQVYFTAVTLTTRDGRAYTPRQDTSGAGLTATQPGFTRTATEVFEVPDTRVPGAQLQVDPDAAAFDVYAEAVRVDLGLRADTPRQPGAVTVTDTTIGVTG